MTVYENYLRDLGFTLKEYALDAKNRATTNENEFDSGYLAGYHRVISLMQQQAEAFGIPLEKLALDGIDPDQDLITANRIS
jgi:hypothetical protein